jgi:hypothetical protein
MIESFMSLTITRKMYGWTKWGGAREGLVKEELDEWYCQACGEKQIKVLPSYMFPTNGTGRDFVRVCTLCKAKSVLKHLKCWQDLINLLD